MSLGRRVAGWSLIAAALGLSGEARAQHAQPPEDARPRSSMVFRSGPGAFDYLHAVATHPRCVNCHGREIGGRLTPTVGDDLRPHPMRITCRHNVPADSKAAPCPSDSQPRPSSASEEKMTLGPLRCPSCHAGGNPRSAAAPPATQSAWHMPVPDRMRLSPALSRVELCNRWKKAMARMPPLAIGGAKPTHGGAFVHHLATDPLIAWAFEPGPGRSPAPGSVPDLEAAATMWVDWLDRHQCAELEPSKPGTREH